jgi:methylated-DNA-[protein]-cysteine S-methyltransferase
MNGTLRNYHIFETASGFCAIVWSDNRVTRFQLPLKSAEAAERLLSRRAPGAKACEPEGEVAAAVTEAKRHFRGEQTDFSGVPIDLGEASALFARIYDALRRVGWGCTTTYGALAKEVGAP